MSDQKFDRLLSEIRNEQVDDRWLPTPVNACGVDQRVATAEIGMHKLRSCEDFQAAHPAYVDKNLPDARRLLLKITCTSVSRAGTLWNRRATANSAIWQMKTASRGFPVWRWAWLQVRSSS